MGPLTRHDLRSRLRTHRSVYASTTEIAIDPGRTFHTFIKRFYDNEVYQLMYVAEDESRDTWVMIEYQPLVHCPQH